MITQTEIVAFFKEKIRYKEGWEFHVGGSDEDSSMFLQLRFEGEDNYKPGFFETQYCRKWQLSKHMVTQELVRTAWKAVLAAEEHEAAELFEYRNKTVMNPHVNYDEIVNLMGSKIITQQVRPKHAKAN